MNRQHGALMSGVVKRYNVEYGYGFIKVDDGEEDCFVHQSEIQKEGFRALLEGDTVEFIFSWKNGKPTATQVSPRDGDSLRLFKNKMDALTISETTNNSSTRAIGTVKWFNQEKGYGFLVRDGFENEPDVFVHINKVKGLDFLSEGQRFQFDLVEEANGKLNAVNVSQLMNSPHPNYLSPSGYQPPRQRPQHTQYNSPALPTQTYGALYSSPYISPVAVASQSSGGIKIGKMKFFNVEKGFGFLFPAEGGKDLYVGMSGLGVETQPEQLVKGTDVEYTLQTSDSKMWATNVRLLNGSEWQPDPRSNYGESYSSSPSKQGAYRHSPYNSGYSSQPAALPTLSGYNQQPAAPHAHSGYSPQSSAPHAHSGYSPQSVALHAHSNYSPQPIAPNTHSGYSQPAENSHPSHTGYNQGGQTGNPPAPRPPVSQYGSYY